MNCHRASSPTRRFEPTNKKNAQGTNQATEQWKGPVRVELLVGLLTNHRPCKRLVRRAGQRLAGANCAQYQRQGRVDAVVLPLSLTVGPFSDLGTIEERENGPLLKWLQRKDSNLQPHG